MAFPEGFAYQPELQLLQVTQPAVDQLAGTAARAGRPVARFQQRCRQPAGSSIQRAAGADDAPADDDDVERLAFEALESRDPGFGTEVHRLHGGLVTRENGHSLSRAQ